MQWRRLLPHLKILDQSWHSWLIQEAVDFRPTDAEGGLQSFVPASWGVMGDDKTSHGDGEFPGDVWGHS